MGQTWSEAFGETYQRKNGLEWAMNRLYHGEKQDEERLLEVGRGSLGVQWYSPFTWEVWRMANVRETKILGSFL